MTKHEAMTTLLHLPDYQSSIASSDDASVTMFFADAKSAEKYQEALSVICEGIKNGEYLFPKNML